MDDSRKGFRTSVLYVVFRSIIIRSSMLGLGLVFVFFFICCCHYEWLSVVVHMVQLMPLPPHRLLLQ